MIAIDQILVDRSNRPSVSAHVRYESYHVLWRISFRDLNSTFYLYLQLYKHEKPAHHGDNFPFKSGCDRHLFKTEEYCLSPASDTNLNVNIMS